MRILINFKRHQCRPQFISYCAALIVATLIACQVQFAAAQIKGLDLSDPSLTDAERKQATLLWLDTYMKDSVLMSKEDTAKIRAAVEQMTPSQLEQWLKATQKLGDYVVTPQWQETRTWLRGFLKVQAIYSDEEIAQLRSDIRNADSDEMLAIMKRIQAKHESLVWMHQASKQSRAMQVNQRNASVAQQNAATSQARSTRSSNLPLFGTGVAKSQKPSKGYRPPGPLIDSQSMARAAVWSEVWGGAGWGVGF